MIQRTFNTALVQKIMREPELLSRSGSKTADIYDPKNQEHIYYLLALEQKEVKGVLILHKQNNICYQGHVNYRTMYWGEGLERHTKEGIEWMFLNTDCKKIISFAPSNYPEVEKHCIAAGMVKEGELQNSTYSEGVMYNDSIMGVQK